jgi:hypothetical protein
MENVFFFCFGLRKRGGITVIGSRRVQEWGNFLRLCCSQEQGFLSMPTVPENSALTEDESVLMEAAKRGDGATVSSLIKKGVDVNARDNRGVPWSVTDYSCLRDRFRDSEDECRENC